MTLDGNQITLLEKVALDGSFHLSIGGPEGWLGYASPRSSLRIWLTRLTTGRYAVALSLAHVAEALGELGDPVEVELPEGAVAARAADDLPALHALVRRAFALSRTLPNALLHRFEQRAKHLPKTTEAERLVVQRVGQDCFRAGLMEYWEGRCAVTGLKIARLLRASHIKPWKDCEDDAERLDVFNGLLLAAHLDAAFDAGLMTVEDDGSLVWSSALDEEARGALGFHNGLRVTRLRDEHRRYLAWHRERVFSHQPKAEASLASLEGAAVEDG